MELVYQKTYISKKEANANQKTEIIFAQNIFKNIFQKRNHQIMRAKREDKSKD